MSKPIYPEIVQGLKVRHRETLEERTVSRTSESVAYAHFESGFGNHLRTFWDRYEPLPQPGDRVRVVRSEHDHCIGVTGLLDGPDVDGEWHTGDEHFGPLSDFEVILPEESEKNMTDNETVAVPAELLKRIYTMARDTGYDEEREEVAALLPKPKPRLVAVNLDDIREAVRSGDPALYDSFDGKPDLQDIIRETVNEAVYSWRGTDYQDKNRDRNDLADIIIERLG